MGASGTVRRTVRMTLARDLHRPPARLDVEEEVDRALAMATGDDDDARSQRQDRAPQGLGFLVLVFVAADRSIGQRAGLGQVWGETVARGRISPTRARCASGSSKLAPDSATITGSTTTGVSSGSSSSTPATASVTSLVPSIPTFTASTPMSSRTARTWAITICAGSGWIALTPAVLCAVTAVIAVIPCTPQRANAFRSAWTPAPPPESEPAMLSTVRVLIDPRSVELRSVPAIAQRV